MANKYKNLNKKIHKLRHKTNMCLNKKAYINKEEAFQKNQTSYQCKYCKLWHNSHKVQQFINQIIKYK